VSLTFDPDLGIKLGLLHMANMFVIAPSHVARLAPELCAGHRVARRASRTSGLRARRSEAAALAMGHVERRDGRLRIIAGHSTVRMTEEYTKIQLGRQEELTRRIQERFANAGQRQPAAVQ